MTPLEEVLSGRDERAACQKRMLASREGAFVCQIGLNVPGFPKRVPGDITIIKDCRRFLLACAGAAPFEEHYLDNGAGLCWQGAFDGKSYDAGALKRAAVEAENSMEAGRVLDIDVHTAEGQLSRLDMGLPPRRCLVCGESAKACARAGTHDPAELRELVIRIIKTAARARDKDNKDRGGGKIDGKRRETGDFCINPRRGARISTL